MTHSRWFPVVRILLFALLGGGLFALGFMAGRDRSASSVEPAAVRAPAPAAVAAPRPTRLQPPLVAAHYFGRQWPKNFIAGFRREHVDADFAALRADGFNAVVLLVSWGDFQPVFEPCCQYDERAFERLGFLIDRAEAAGLEVLLRVGYGWYFHPDGGDVFERIHRVMNDATARQAFFALLDRLASEFGSRPHLRMSFLSWEDLWLRRIDEAARPDYVAFLSSLAADDPLRAELPADGQLPAADGPHAAVFHRYWDWLLTERLMREASTRLSPLSLEARIDRDPLPIIRPDGGTDYRWLGHETSYRPPGADVMTLYWAPYWGAENRGETLDAERAATLFSALLAEARQHSGGRPLFVDQLNVVDNTLGHDHNAVLATGALPEFMRRAGCALKANGALGYGYWTVHDYAESPLYNPAFGYGLDGWQLRTADGDGAGDASARLIANALGDNRLDLRAGDRLSQIIPAGRGRLPDRNRPLASQVCIVAHSDSGARLSADAGGPAVGLELAPGHAGEACADIAPVPGEDRLTLNLTLTDGALMLGNVLLFDHVQTGGVYGRDGQPLALRDPLRTLNAAYARGGPDACDAPETPVQAR